MMWLIVRLRLRRSSTDKWSKLPSKALELTRKLLAYKSYHEHKSGIDPACNPFNIQHPYSEVPSLQAIIFVFLRYDLSLETWHNCLPMPVRSALLLPGLLGLDEFLHGGNCIVASFKLVLRVAFPFEYRTLDRR
jgi:hypothetical protein